jgi:hypothetical protein
MNIKKMLFIFTLWEKLNFYEQKDQRKLKKKFRKKFEFFRRK